MTAASRGARALSIGGGVACALALVAGWRSWQVRAEVKSVRREIELRRSALAAASSPVARPHASSPTGTPPNRPFAGLPRAANARSSRAPRPLGPARRLVAPTRSEVVAAGRARSPRVGTPVRSVDSRRNGRASANGSRRAPSLCTDRSVPGAPPEIAFYEVRPRPVPHIVGWIACGERVEVAFEVGGRVRWLREGEEFAGLEAIAFRARDAVVAWPREGRQLLVERPGFTVPPRSTAAARVGEQR